MFKKVMKILGCSIFIAASATAATLVPKAAECIISNTKSLCGKE